MDNQDNKIRMTVIIAGRPYSLKVEAEDEPVILRLTKEINDKVKQFQTTYKSCLLYTSPSPRDLSTSRMPSSA